MSEPTIGRNLRRRIAPTALSRKLNIDPPCYCGGAVMGLTSDTAPPQIDLLVGGSLGLLCLQNSSDDVVTACVLREFDILEPGVLLPVLRAGVLLRGILRQLVRVVPGLVVPLCGSAAIVGQLSRRRTGGDPLQGRDDLGSSRTRH